MSVLNNVKVKKDILNEIANDKIDEDFALNTCIKAVKLCEQLENTMVVIFEIRKNSGLVEDGKIALTESEIKIIKELSKEIEEYEEIMASNGLSVSFH